MKYLSPRILTLSAIALSMITAQEAQALDVELAPASLATVLDQLNQLTGETWTADRSFLFDVVMVRAQDTDAADLRTRLAAALNGEWKQEDKTWKLVRKNSEATTAAQVAFQARKDRFAAAAKEAAAKASDKPMDLESARALQQEWTSTMDSFKPGGIGANPGVMEKISLMNARMPGARAVSKILSKIDISQLAGIAPYSRVVFGTLPTLMQRNLPTSAWPEIRQFALESQYYQKAEDEKRDPQNERVFRFGSVIQSYNNDAQGSPTYAILVAQRSNWADSIDLNLVVANEKGETICTGGMTLTPAALPPTTATFAVEDAKPIAWSADAKALAQAIPNADGAAGGGGRMVMVSVTSNGPTGAPGKPRTFTSDGATTVDKATLPASIRERVLNPEKYDPLSLHVAEGLLKLADVAGKDLIAVIPDRLFGSMLSSVRDQASPKTLAEQLQTRFAMQAVVDGKWLIFVPKDSEATRDDRVNRSALGPMLRLLDQKGLLRLGERANYEATRPLQLTSNPLDNLLVTAINPAYAAEKFSFSRGGESEMLRFYGRLSPTQRKSLVEGGTVSINQLTGPQLEALERIVWHSLVGPASLAPEPDGALNIGMARGMVMPGPLRFNTERTVVLGNGIAKSGSVQFKVEKVPAVVGSTPNGGKSVLTSEDLARNKLASEGGAPIMASAPVAFEKFQTADKFEFDITILLGKDYGVRRWLDDFTFDPSKPAVPYAALDAEFRKAVEDDYRGLKEMMDGMREGGFPGRGNGQRP